MPLHSVGKILARHPLQSAAGREEAMTELSTHIIDSFHASGYPKCVNIRRTQFVSAEIKIAGFFPSDKKSFLSMNIDASWRWQEENMEV